ncbi:hypothetical protein CS063_05830 [Sporanaerobium hydrogeniformans]|uniref:Uncharacterized protein n=1 Tax=Sporanaerobium hydrogeniformans TaxID=3072179 RepID=A0AC61DEA1_9FIRM|nr:DUF6145 family protein [Sporanaerobium hydrogeniformans]PHV71210.1 hypothetical protein CS063_05830 [Sporanaerobium hydrogeniformans]
MGKKILISVSPYVQKYYFNEEFKGLPESIKDEVRAKLAIIAEKVNCIMTLGFNEEGEIFIEERYEDPMNYDEIGAGLEIKKLQTEEKEMFRSLKLWYMIYATQNGQIVREILVLQQAKKKAEEIIDYITDKYDEKAGEFARELLAE